MTEELHKIMAKEMGNVQELIALRNENADLKAKINSLKSRLNTMTPKTEELDVSEIDYVDEVLKILKTDKQEVLIKMKLRHYREALLRQRASDRERCVNIVKSLKSPYPADLLPSKQLLPTKKEKDAWRFGDLVFNNTKNDILDLLYSLSEDSPKPRKGFGIIKELK